MGQTLSTQEEELKAQREVFKKALLGDKAVDAEFIISFNEFIKGCPKALVWKDEFGETLLMALFYYLSGAFERRDRLDEFRDLVTPQTSRVFRMKNCQGWTLLHNACQSNPRALDVISFVLEQCPEAARRFNEWKQTPLHIACIHRASLPVVELLVSECPQAVLARDYEGQTPLHDRTWTCSNRGSLEVIRFLAMKELVACLARDDDGDLPVDVAKCSHKPAGVIAFLTSVTKAATEVLTDEILHRSEPRLHRDIVAHVASFLHEEGPSDVAVLDLLLSKDEIFPMLHRDDVRSKILARITA